MARRRSGLGLARRVSGGVLGFGGLFLACFGLGSGLQTVLITGLVMIGLAGSSRLLASVRRPPRQWLRGTGQVVEVSEPPADFRFGRCSMQLLVDAPGLTGESVMVHDSRAPVAQWPRPGQELPVQVAADDVRHVRVLWREVAPLATPAGPQMPAGAEPSEAAPGPGSWDEVPTAEPAPATPPRPRLDEPEPHLIDFDLDSPPTGPLLPVAPDAANPTGWPAAPEPSVDARPADPEPADPEPADAQLAAAESAAAQPAADAPAVPGEPETRIVPGAAPESGRPLPRPRPHPHAAPEPPETPTVSGGGTQSGEPAGAIHRIGVTVLVSELDRSVVFYRDTLGFEEVDEGQGTTVLASGDTRLVLRQADDLGAVKHRLVHLNLEVGDIDASYDELRANGVRFTYPPRAANQTARLEQWAAAFRDPDGHGIAITQWRPREPTPARV